IGGLYTRAQGLDERVAMAIYDQYTPASIEDPIPTSIEGQLLGIADRIQTISAMLSRNFIPTGSRDPFALRRAANGVIKILAESNLPLTLKDVLIATEGRTELADTVPTGIQGSAIGFDNPRAGYLPDFLVERVSFYLKEVRGFAYDVVAAVFAAGAESSDSIAPPVIPAGADDVRDAIARAEALTAVRGSDDFAAVSAAFKRIKNILRQAAEKNIEIGSSSNIQADEALRLRAAANSIAADFAALRGQRAYSDALSLIATLRPVVDTFFDKVMVLDSDPVIRGANLALIDEVLRNFSTIADFSEIVTSA
ncbi:MAG TPA: glycine--tRNA ligase subunit beta, partial [Terracidiphilus sp.]|nr:glycine--tRNA ligase subunit beta [Terracidiphilus sp.]